MVEFLAQVPEASPVEIGKWLVCLAAVLAIAKYIKDLFVRKPSIESEFATKRDVEKLEAEMDRRFEDLAIERARNIGELHEKINEVGKGVARIEGRLEKRDK